SPNPARRADAVQCRGPAGCRPGPAAGRCRGVPQGRHAAATRAGLGERGRAFARHGETQAARAAHAEAVAIYDTLDAAWDIRRADTRLRALGIRRGQRGPRRRPAGWDALTPVELTIAAQVAQGRTNPDIAADLFLSRRTVQS